MADGDTTSEKPKKIKSNMKRNKVTKQESRYLASLSSA